MKTGSTQKTKRNEIEAMYIICNIQQMQKCIYSKSFAYDDFKGNTIDELRDLQNNLITDYNKWAMAI